MNDLKVTPVNFAMQAGLFLGILALIRFFLLAFSLDIASVGLFYLLVALFFHYAVFYYVNNYRKTVLEGEISFLQAWNVALLIYFFSSILCGAGEFIFYKYLNPTFISTFVPKTTETIQLLASKTDDLYTKNILLNLANKSANSGIPTAIEMVFAHIQNSVFSGIFTSLIIAGIVSRKRNSNNKPVDNGLNNDTL